MVVKVLTGSVIALLIVFVIAVLQVDRVRTQLAECRSATAQQNQAVVDVAQEFNDRVIEQKAKDVTLTRNVEQHQITTDAILNDRIDPACKAAIEYGIAYAPKLKAAA
jgi:galactokinase/mevalonate kinase-like predicted kinase